MVLKGGDAMVYFTIAFIGFMSGLTVFVSTNFGVNGALALGVCTSLILMGVKLIVELLLFDFWEKLRKEAVPKQPTS